LPLEPVLLPELELVSLGELVLLEPLVPPMLPVLPVVLVLPPVPLVPVVLPEVPPAAPALVPEAPDDFFADFLCFLAFFFFGVVLLAPVSLWPDDEVADGVEVLAPEPEAPLVSPDAPVEVLPLEEPLMPLPDVPVPEVPDAPLPDMPDAPEDPDAPLDEVPLAPEEPEEVAPGVDAEVPLPPDMPVSLPVPAPVVPLWLCVAGLDEVVEDLLVSVDELCANAIEDTDAITTRDKDRSVVFNAMRDSFELKEKHHRCRNWCPESFIR
jgi:hypothetical protein